MSEYIDKLDSALEDHFDLLGGWIGNTKKKPPMYFHSILFRERLFVVYLKMGRKFSAFVIKPGTLSTSLITRITDKDSAWSPDLFLMHNIKTVSLKRSKIESIRLSKLWLIQN